MNDKRDIVLEAIRDVNGMQRNELLKLFVKLSFLPS